MEPTRSTRSHLPNGYPLTRSDAHGQGPIADSILAKIRKTGGIMAQSDLDGYRVRVRPALEGTFRGRKVYTSHAPTSGPGKDRVHADLESA